jgi:hypothetical protein
MHARIGQPIDATLWSMFFTFDVMGDVAFSIDEEPEDVGSWLLKAVYEKDASASPTLKSLADDNRGVVIAGKYVGF